MSEMNPSPEFEEKIRKAVAVPNADPQFVNQLRNELAKKPVKMKPRWMFRPAWALAFVLALVVISLSLPGVASAIGRLLGYVPNVGLVENTGNLRRLAEPVSVTRDGVTLTITSALVYADHVELMYEVQGLAPVNDGNSTQNINADGKQFCGPLSSLDANGLTDGDAALRLPDGTIIKRMFGNEYAQNVFTMKPVYKTSIPANVDELTMLLKCIPNARLGAVPENWEVPFKLISVPADTIVGAPVIVMTQPTTAPTVEAPASAPTDQPASHTPDVTLKLEKIVPLNSATVFYISLNMEHKDPSLISIMPSNVYALDAHGEKVWLIGNYTWQPFEHPVGSEFQFTTQTKPAEGPINIVVENAVAVYAPMYTDPPQATPDQMTFIFDAGENPQYGQTWSLNQEFNIVGYPLKVTSVRAANFKDIEYMNFPLGSQGFEYGYDFTIETDPKLKLQPELEIMSDNPVCYLSNSNSTDPQSLSPLHYIQLCRDSYPKGIVKVQIWQLLVLIENTWQVTWTPQ